jgi:hypothetical protein
MANADRRSGRSWSHRLQLSMMVCAGLSAQKKSGWHDIEPGRFKPIVEQALPLQLMPILQQVAYENEFAFCK